MRAVIVLQARTASTRLPGKALLPVGDYPSAILAASRAANLGDELLVATTDDASDDELVRRLQENNFKTLRGPVNDVLQRFYLATLELPSDCLIVRLTGDNVVPDGEFVRQLIARFCQSHAEYLNAGWPESRLPYGLAGEVFDVETLRKAHAAATSAYDREHVGPWMARNCCSVNFATSALGASDFSRLRCTLDDQEDYQRICRLFRDIPDPVHIPWLELALRLDALPGEPRFRVPHKIIGNRVHGAMTLGTAQLGMEYGAVNFSGKPSEADAVGIVRQAIAHGVTTLDTARAYGDAERILGKALAGAWGSRASVITKLDPLADTPADASLADLRSAIDRSVHASCTALGTTSLGTLLLHRWAHRNAWRGCAWHYLLDKRDSGRVAKLGVSVYDPSEALAALEDKDIQHIQLPLNLLDRRWKAQGVDRKLGERADVVVHARSAFLQGILLHPADCWPAVDGADARDCIRKLHEWVGKFDREDVADLCLAYARSQRWVTSVVVGCENMTQLRPNLRAFCSSPLTQEQCEEIEDTFSSLPEALLNPSKWKLAHA